MIEIKDLDVVFGQKADRAIPLLEQGKNREQIRDELGLVLGVQGANLSIEKGEICVLMGLSGSGKSSLLRCINGLNPVTRGSVNLEHKGDTINFAEADGQLQREIRTQRISMVFQKFALMPWLTVEENVAFPLELQGLDKAEIKERVQKQLEIVGLDQWRKLKPSKLSGGMQQRVGLARALVTESDILLMDEPFSALDPLIRTQLQDELLQLQEQLQKTIIFVSHDLDEALKIGTHIAIMKDGEIVQHGKPQDIVLNPTNDYVKDFVAHTNPINVLQAYSIMRPLNELDQTDTDGYCLSHRNDIWLGKDLERVRCQSTHVNVQKWSNGQDINALDAAPTRVIASIPMRDIMEIRHHTGYPVIIEDKNEVCGVIGDRELYHTLLGKMMNED